MGQRSSWPPWDNNIGQQADYPLFLSHVLIPDRFVVCTDGCMACIVLLHLERRNFLMLPANIRLQTEYLSEHFDDPVCREELRHLIGDYLKGESHKGVIKEK